MGFGHGTAQGTGKGHLSEDYNTVQRVRAVPITLTVFLPQFSPLSPI
jgi:hypothetical protein